MDSDNDLYIQGDLEVDGTIYAASITATSLAWDDLTAPTADLTLAMAAYNTTFNWDPGANSAETSFSLTTQGEDSTGGGDEAQILLSLSQTDNGVDVDEAADALVSLSNADANDPVGAGILFGTGSFTNYIDTPSSVYKVDGSGNVTGVDLTLTGGDITGAGGASIDIGEATGGDITFTGDLLVADDSFIGMGQSGDCPERLPGDQFAPSQLAKLAEKVHQGMGLLMIGRWASFTGANREYTEAVLRELLPVIMQKQDDRVNSWQPCLIEKKKDHAIVGDLPFDGFSPSVGGFNRFQAKSDAETILTVRQIEVSRKEDKLVFSPSFDGDPLLVIGNFGLGRVGAFASDVAPHWVGGLVDWGVSRISVRAEGANQREVGNWYAAFFERVIRWVIKG